MKLLFLILAILCFLFAAFAVAVGTIAMIPLGLAFFAISFLPIKE